jgi:hypothetical protein
MSKKILVVSRAFYPQNSPRSFRTTELVKEFCKQGHAVTLLTVLENDFDYSDFLAQYPISLESMGDLKWKHFRKNRSFFGDLPRKLDRLLHLFLEYPNIEILFRLKKILPKYKDFDLLISVAVPHSIHWGVAAVRNPKNPIAKIWVADCGDPFMGNTLESIRPPFYFSYFEKKFCRAADFISIPTTTALNGYYPEFHSKIVVIPQGFNFEDTPVVQTEAPNEILNFAYAGGVSLSGIRSPKKLIEFLLESGVPFQFHIYSNTYAVLTELAAAAPTSIFLHPPLPRTELLNELAKMDFLLNLDNGSTNQTPSKLIDYALVGKPILNVTAAHFDPALVTSFLNREYSQQLIIENIERFNITNVAHQFLSLNNESHPK